MRARGRRAGLLAVAGLTLGALVLPGGTASGAGGGGGAAATVGNGITTADLASVGVTPAALAASLVGDGVTVSNVSYTGAAAQAGTIHVADPAVVSFNDGIILSSGDIANIVGPNSSDGITGDMGGGDDADLNALIADTQTVNPITFDAASLEFDFVPTADTIYFTYTWASDEYLEWVNLFNDVFAFYVNGQNCATTPGGDPVSIDTINDAVNPQLFRDNA
ncbi:MAG TPA: choice-of-anchor L domain-containing protein, partial [Aquihabitans sp.]|nr:choice-of-anchor L domain-containing protein [Aquihabitans sp.]